MTTFRRWDSMNHVVVLRFPSLWWLASLPSHFNPRKTSAASGVPRVPLGRNFICALQWVKKLLVHLFARATEMNGGGIAPLRVVKQNRTKVPAANAHEYNRRAVLNYYICTAQLHKRFHGYLAIVNRFALRLPQFCNSASFVEVRELTQHVGLQFFSCDLDPIPTSFLKQCSS